MRLDTIVPIVTRGGEERILTTIYTFILHIFLKTTYIVENKTLKIKCGFLFNKNILIDDIKGIKKTKNLISSPAPSFDRIEIKYGKFDEVIISPKDKVGFAKDLTLINPTIVNDQIKMVLDQDYRVTGIYQSV